VTDFILPPPTPPSVAIIDSAARFPVRRIFCVGRNYAAHAREMGHDPNREPPFFFMKPSDTLVDDGSAIPYPPLTNNLHFEGELVVAIGKSASNIKPEHSQSHIWGYAIGNDLTRRDLQSEAKKLGRPWDWGKGFDRSAICGPLHPVATIGALDKGAIETTVNGKIRQSADLADLIWSIPEVISILSTSVTIKPGDLIYTGTPAGIGPLICGDICQISIEQLGKITTTIA